MGNLYQILVDVICEQFLKYLTDSTLSKLLQRHFNFKSCLIWIVMHLAVYHFSFPSLI